MSKDVEVRIGQYGAGLFAKNDIEPNTNLVKLRLVLKINLVLLSVKKSSKMNWSNILSINLKPSFWNEDQITVQNAFEEFKEFDMRLVADRMQEKELLALYLAIESKFWHWGCHNGLLSIGCLNLGDKFFGIIDFHSATHRSEKVYNCLS